MFSVPGLRLLLASTSPRRRQLLTSAGIPFELVRPGDEPAGTAPTPSGLAIERASAKARGAAWGEVVDDPERTGPEPVVLGVDTVVELGGREFGKAGSRDEARAMLRALSGREHQVHTALHLALPWRSAPGDFLETLDSAVVRFRPIGDEELAAYLASDAWQGKAGAYGIQDPEVGFAELLSGDLEAVIGLATRTVEDLLHRLAPNDS